MCGLFSSSSLRPSLRVSSRSFLSQTWTAAASIFIFWKTSECYHTNLDYKNNNLKAAETSHWLPGNEHLPCDSLQKHSRGRVMSILVTMANSHEKLSPCKQCRHETGSEVLSLMVLEGGLKALYVRGKCSITELHPSCNMEFKNIIRAVMCAVWEDAIHLCSLLHVLAGAKLLLHCSPYLPCFIFQLPSCHICL